VDAPAPSEHVPPGWMAGFRYDQTSVVRLRQGNIYSLGVLEDKLESSAIIREVAADGSFVEVFGKSSGNPKSRPRAINNCDFVDSDARVFVDRLSSDAECEIEGVFSEHVVFR